MFDLLSENYRRKTAVCLAIFGILVAGIALFAGGLLELPTDEPAERTLSDQQSAGDRTTDIQSPTNGTTTDTSTEQLVVRFDPLTAESNVSLTALEEHANETQAEFVERFADNDSVKILEQFWVANAVLVELETDHMSRSSIENAPGVIRVHDNFAVEPAGYAGDEHDAASAVVTGSSPYPPTTETQLRATSHAHVSTQYTYGVEMVRAPAVWERFETRGEGVTVAVLDTGVDPRRLDLTVEEWAEFDDVGGRVGSTPHDRHGHGTHVAGTVLGDDASGLAIGVAPGATLHGVKVTDDDGSGTFAQILAGMEWATRNDDVDIIQMSLGVTGRISAFREPVTNALDAGTLVVAASGNDGVDTSSSPANIYEALAVGAVGQNRQVPPFSSGETLDTTADWNWRGQPPDWPATYVVPTVTAPGVAVPSAQAGTRAGLSATSGTSMATPHVSGVAALLIAAADGSVQPSEISRAIRETSVHPLGNETPDDRFGHGIVDALAAVEEITGTPGGTTTFEVDIVETNSPVTAGSKLEVETTLTNSGTAEGTQVVGLDIDGIGPLDTQNVTLGAGDTTTVTLRWQTTADNAGEYTATAASEDDAESRAVTVDGLEPARFEITALEFDERVTPGEEFDVTATLRNTGDVQGYQEIALDIGEEGTVDRVTLLLEANETATVDLTWPTDAGDEGAHTFTVSSFNDEQTHTVTVRYSGENHEGESEPTPADERERIDESSSGLVVLLVVGILATVALVFWRRRTRS